MTFSETWFLNIQTDIGIVKQVYKCIFWMIIKCKYVYYIWWKFKQIKKGSFWDHVKYQGVHRTWIIIYSSWGSIINYFVEFLSLYRVKPFSIYLYWTIIRWVDWMEQNTVKYLNWENLDIFTILLTLLSC